MGNSTEATAGQGPRQKAPRRGAVPAGNARPVLDPGLPEAAPQPVSLATAPTVDGATVAEFAALISPSAFLISADGGTHEVTRCYYQGGKYSVAHSTDRLGEFACVGAELTGDRLTIAFHRKTDGSSWLVRIPGNRVMATHRPL